MTPPTTRLAPSPTGLLHLGHARSFLAAWWCARSEGGRVVLRIEDLDTGRSRPEFTDAARRDLEWLGLDWDGPELVQSEDLAPYHDAARRLLERGDAFACVCSRRDVLEALDAPHAADTELRYPGTCRDRFTSVQDAEHRTGATAGVRLRVPEGRFAIRDEFAGRFEADPAREVGDFLLLRRDGAVSYQLAVVVDDARQGVDLVVRGDDLLPSAVRQALLQRALGLPHPRWLHLPLVTDADGNRLSKRAGAQALSTLRERGVDPRLVADWAARSLGLAGDAARATAREWLPRFRVAALAPRSAGTPSSLAPDPVDP
ncbi:MAG: tRNA glutamyl-Q(34) synthetase GluQRS [Planctomycetota bacterium]